MFAGIIAGTAFQIFEELYISGQIWISRYNAIYGSFAALPLLLLWLQLSWFLILIGVELSFSYQNVNKFSFEKKSSDISPRYKDFVSLSVMTLIVKRFKRGEKPFTADELSEKYRIPTQLTSDIIYTLLDAGLLLETATEKSLVSGYIPGIDINQITVSYFFDKLDQLGSEDYDIDKREEFKEEWEMISHMRESIKCNYKKLLSEL